MNVLAESFVGSDASKWAIVASTALATAAFVCTTAVIFGRRQARIDRRIAGYEVAPAVEAPPPSGPETAIVQSGIELAERLARGTTLSRRVDKLLEQADVPIRPGELLFYVPTFAVLAFLLGAVALDAVAGIAVAAIVASAPLAYLAGRRRRRLRRFEETLPATLGLLAGSLRAGFSLLQGLETVAQEIGEPSRRELQRVFTEVRLGRTPEDALGDVAARMESKDLAWTVMAIQIQREVGGNLAALLDTVADTMQKRAQLRREVRALTAEGRLSAVVLSLFPPGLALVLWTIQPDYIERLFEEALGIVAIVIAAAASVVGWFWLRKIIDIEE